MDIKDLEIKIKKDFNNAICLIGLIPFAVFIYLITAKAGSFSMLTGQTGFIMAITMILILLGITTGKKMLWVIIKRLFAFNQEVLSLQDSLVEKNRLAAVTETALALSHEVDNPLLIMRGNIELLQEDIREVPHSDSLNKRVDTLKAHCERIRTVTEKLSNLGKVSSITIHGDSKMINLGESESIKTSE